MAFRKSGELPWCDNGPNCRAAIKLPHHRDCPCGCTQSTTTEGRNIRICSGCHGEGFCVSWFSRGGMWLCAKCRDKAWQRFQADREPRRESLGDLYQHERGAEHQSPVRRPK